MYLFGDVSFSAYIYNDVYCTFYIILKKKNHRILKDIVIISYLLFIEGLNHFRNHYGKRDHSCYNDIKQSGRKLLSEFRYMHPDGCIHACMERI